MHTRAPSASLLADRGVAFTFVVLFHIALGYAFISGLTTTLVKRIAGPLVVSQVAEARRPEVTPPPPQIRFTPLEIPQVDDPIVTTAEDDGVHAQTRPLPNESPGESLRVPAPTLTPVRMDPRHPLKIGPDHYPDSAIRFNQEGRCVVSIGVAADGRIADFALQTGTGFESLDAACLNAVRGQRMLPALQDGKPVASRASIPIVWKLESR
jgi:periplasmic protein TonB